MDCKIGVGMMAVYSLHTSGRDIDVVPPIPEGGHDKIIGDLHGSLSCFMRVLESLNPDDRLFLVGDLIDRGENSPGIIQAIIDFQVNNEGRLFSVRGNHESLCLHAIIALEELTPAFPNLPNEYLSNDQSNFSDWINIAAKFPILESHPDQSLTDLYNHVMNGGDWLLNLFGHELITGVIKKNQDGLIEYSTASQVNLIKGFILPLPYILYVQGTRPFNVVHADMPVDDEELLRKIHQGDAFLTDSQKNYATWFRPHNRSVVKPPIKSVARDAKSNITYTGHSIIAYGDAPVIRYETNTVDIDVATYINNISLMVDHTGGNCRFLGEGIDKVKENSCLYNAQKELDTYLQAQLNK